MQRLIAGIIAFLVLMSPTGSGTFISVVAPGTYYAVKHQEIENAKAAKLAAEQAEKDRIAAEEAEYKRVHTYDNFGREDLDGYCVMQVPHTHFKKNEIMSTASTLRLDYLMDEGSYIEITYKTNLTENDATNSGKNICEFKTEPNHYDISTDSIKAERLEEKIGKASLVDTQETVEDATDIEESTEADTSDSTEEIVESTSSDEDETVENTEESTTDEAKHDLSPQSDNPEENESTETVENTDNTEESTEEVIEETEPIKTIDDILNESAPDENNTEATSSDINTGLDSDKPTNIVKDTSENEEPGFERISWCMYTDKSALVINGYVAEGTDKIPFIASVETILPKTNVYYISKYVFKTPTTGYYSTDEFNQQYPDIEKDNTTSSGENTEVDEQSITDFSNWVDLRFKLDGDVISLNNATVETFLNLGYQIDSIDTIGDIVKAGYNSVIALYKSDGTTVKLWVVNPTDAALRTSALTVKSCLVDKENMGFYVSGSEYNSSNLPELKILGTYSWDARAEELLEAMKQNSNASKQERSNGDYVLEAKYDYWYLRIITNNYKDIKSIEFVDTSK